MPWFSDRAGSGISSRLALAPGVAFRPYDGVGTPKVVISRLSSPACVYPCQRFVVVLTDGGA